HSNHHEAGNRTVEREHQPELQRFRLEREESLRAEQTTKASTANRDFVWRSRDSRKANAEIQCTYAADRTGGNCDCGRNAKRCVQQRSVQSDEESKSEHEWSSLSHAKPLDQLRCELQHERISQS